MEDIKQINEKYGQILENKALLNDTDWEVIKATELHYEISTELLQQRAQARQNINTLEAEIEELETQL